MRNVVSICVGVAALAAVLSGQGAVAPDGTMRELVTEIRSLRADLNRVAGANIRAQLLFGRLQLQEQRTITLARQLDAIQQELANVGLQRAAMEDRVKDVEDGNVRPEERAEVERAVRRDLRMQQKREQQLRQQESSLSAMVAEEQARWTDFSSRLDDLERALTSPPR